MGKDHIIKDQFHSKFIDISFRITSIFKSNKKLKSFTVKIHRYNPWRRPLRAFSPGIWHLHSPGADPMLWSVSRSAGSSLCEQHKDYRYRTGKSPAEKKTGMAYSVKYYPWYRSRLPAVNDSSNFRLEWIFIRIYVVSSTDL